MKLSSRVVIALFICGCLNLAACHKKPVAMTNDSLLKAYDTAQDWNDPQHPIPLDYQQAQGKRVFYTNCVWCHADTTPAGPSNRGNLTPTPPLLNDGAALNGLSDEFMQNIITLGGSAMGKSAMMPPWGRTLTPDEIRAVVAFARVVAQPPYRPPASRTKDARPSGGTPIASGPDQGHCGLATRTRLEKPFPRGLR